jgi:hypothetical protein
MATQLLALDSKMQVASVARANHTCLGDFSVGGGSAAVAICDNRQEATSSGALDLSLTLDALMVFLAVRRSPGLERLPHHEPFFGAARRAASLTVQS